MYTPEMLDTEADINLSVSQVMNEMDQTQPPQLALEPLTLISNPSPKRCMVVISRLSCLAQDMRNYESSPGSLEFYDIHRGSYDEILTDPGMLFLLRLQIDYIYCMRRS